ncbi:Sin3 associated polypeptide p18-domain-containing protein [Daldinia loculata]|uniref:Sin3 associated polypeptide p18-domain-containing protein n=1 Tax=Daldinia loculata TaxID=103429 RepID=UPI0020C347A4|nr:Sin3 associated polypeptide p18-domain-containing protein [Daldinia loculata]KAI1648545.1 Sin3 associated polypeptide p18-domain-containing protein [Daldinia loculata]
MDRHATPPFMLRLFYRTGAFHRPDEFNTSQLPPHMPIYTWPDCTLTELTYIIAALKPSLVPDPAIGTRFAFRLIFPDTRNTSGPTSSKYTVKDLGSVIVGNGGRGLDPDDPEAEKTLDSEGDKTLKEARFVVGDFISCAILPPLPDGSVAPVSSARVGRSAGASEPRAAVGRTPSSSFSRREQENGLDRSGRLRNSGRGYDGFGSRGSIPMGEWRRGERLPESPPAGRGRGTRRT